MILILYSNESGSGTINKTLSNELNLNVSVRSDFDVINPQFKLAEIDGVDFTTYNYCYLPELGRYYFIDNKTLVNRKVTLFECSCDVLETYKQNILSSNARFYRNIKSGDYIEGVFDRSSQASVNIHQSDVSLAGEHTLVLTTIGGYSE